MAVGVAIVFVATLLRIRGGLDDLWLDEVWSLKLVSAISSPWQVFTAIHHDNNHYLNSLWLYLLGPHQDPIWYRLPSIIAGAGTVIVAGLIGYRRNAAAAFFAMWLTAFSYPMILYGSEARGYSCVVFFSFLAFYALDAFLERPRWQMAALYSASAVLSLSSHLVFINVLLAAMVWCWWRTKSVKVLLQCQAAPVIFLAFLYFADVQHMVEGGGESGHSLLYTFGLAMAWALGASKILWCLVSVVILAAAFYLRRKEPSGSFLFFAGVILVFPISLAVVRNSDTIFVRYFILSMAFLLLLASDVLAWLVYRSRTGMMACLLLLLIYTFVNTVSIGRLHIDGRGHYRAAIRYMAEHSHGSTITIDSDNDFQVPLMLDYYADALEGKKMEYRLKKSGPWGAEWLVCQKDSLDDPAPPHAHFVESAGAQYELVATYPTAPLSGLRWYLYQKRAP